MVMRIHKGVRESGQGQGGAQGEGLLADTLPSGGWRGEPGREEEGARAWVPGSLEGRLEPGGWCPETPADTR